MNLLLSTGHNSESSAEELAGSRRVFTNIRSISKNSTEREDQNVLADSKKFKKKRILVVLGCR